MAEKEYIEREDVLNFLEETRDGLKGTPPFVELLNQCIDALRGNFQPADVVEVVHAAWIPHEHVSRSPYARNYDCSACGNSPIETGDFCNNCGAKMDGGKTK